MYGPDDWSALQWHRADAARRYGSRKKAERAANWLNSNEHVDDQWRFMAGGQDRDGRWFLLWRWVGPSIALIDQDDGDGLG